jgi:hypothetical protein
MLGEIRRFLSADDRWNVWTPLIALGAFGVVMTAMLWLAAGDFSAHVSSRQSEPDNATVIHNLFFRN